MTESGRSDFGADAGRQWAVPVLDVCPDENYAYPNGDTVPGIWVTAPVADENGDLLGRVRTVHYPDDEYGDAHGDDALYFGGGYYDEAMEYADPADHDKRVDCFRAAELLYRHASGRGNAVADLCLGYVYSYDRCEGRYWAGPAAAGAGGAESPYPREARAFDCLKRAAEADFPEACYKLGDMYKHGTGCVPDAGEAFRWYVRASELAAHERPVILGSVALRLAGCYEEGFGCELDFERAHMWYQRAVAALGAAVEAGESWYGKALAGAKAGLRRCKQEIG